LSSDIARTVSREGSAAGAHNYSVWPIPGFKGAPGTGAAAIRAQYSTDQSSWNYLDGSAGPSVTVSTTGLKVSGWVSVTAAAKADVFIRAVGIAGDASADPAFANVLLQVK
jgi:hypothetical protein